MGTVGVGVLESVENVVSDLTCGFSWNRREQSFTYRDRTAQHFPSCSGGEKRTERQFLNCDGRPRPRAEKPF